MEKIRDSIIRMESRKALEKYHATYVNSGDDLGKLCMEINEILFEVLGGHIIKHGVDWPEALKVIIYAMNRMNDRLKKDVIAAMTHGERLDL